MPFDLTSPVASSTNNSKQKSYPTGVKYPVTCLYCTKKWLVEMGATNLICSCGNQLYVLQKVSRVAYEDLKEKVTKQLMSHYDKFHKEIQEKVKEDMEKKQAAAAAAVAAAKANKARLDSAAAAAAATKLDAAKRLAESKNDTDITDPNSKKRKISEVDDNDGAINNSNNNNSDNSKRPKLDALDTNSNNKNNIPNTTVKLTGDDLKKKLPSSSPDGSPKAMGSIIGGGGPGGINRKLSSGSPRVAGKNTTLIVQCPKCERNVIVPKVASKVFQCPCGQYMTIQQQNHHNLGSPKPDPSSGNTTPTGTNIATKNKIVTTTPAAASNKSNPIVPETTNNNNTASSKITTTDATTTNATNTTSETPTGNIDTTHTTNIKTSADVSSEDQSSEKKEVPEDDTSSKPKTAGDITPVP